MDPLKLSPSRRNFISMDFCRYICSSIPGNSWFFMTTDFLPPICLNDVHRFPLALNGKYSISITLDTLIARFMGPIWGRQDPGGPHVGPTSFAIWIYLIWRWSKVLLHRKFRSSNFRHWNNGRCAKYITKRQQTKWPKLFYTLSSLRVQMYISIKIIKQMLISIHVH